MYNICAEMCAQEIKTAEVAGEGCLGGYEGLEARGDSRVAGMEG